MNTNLFVIIVGFLSLIIGGFIGVQIFKVYNKNQNKKLLENAKQVLSGDRDNKIKIDGQEYDANKFIVRDEDDKEITIDLQGGGIVQNGTRKENNTRAEEVQEQKVEDSGKISSSSGEKKRNFRIGSILSRRLRRFG